MFFTLETATTYLTRQVAQRHRHGAFRPAGFDNTSDVIASTIVLTAPAATLNITLNITLRRRCL
jgi:hypothetical protein